MGLLSGGLNGRRFRVTTPLPPDFRDVYLEQVRGNAFVDADTASDPEPRLGWVNVFDAAGTTFELNDLLVDRYLTVSLRTDTKKIQGKYLEIAVSKKAAEVAAERGKDLTRKEREEIEESLTAALYQRALPSVATTDLAWDIHTGHVVVFSTSEGPLEHVRQLVRDTFGVALHAERLVDWLTDKFTWEELTERVDQHLPGGRKAKGLGVVIDGWREENPLDGHELGLASDFLTWLWLQSESSDGLFRMVEGPRAAAALEPVESAPAPADEPVDPASVPEESPAAPVVLAEVADEDEDDDDGEAGWSEVTETLRNAKLVLWIDGRLKLRELDEKEPSTTILLGVAPSTTPEARETMNRGKRPVEAQIGLAVNDLECSLVLQATPEGLTISGLKMPFAVKDGREEKLLERVVLLEVVHGTIRRLFQQFFLARTSPTWGERVDRWLSEELAAK